MILLDSLREVHFLEDFAEIHLQKLSSIAVAKDFAAAAVIFREGRGSAFVYVVQTGRVSLEICGTDRGSTPLQTVGPGELLGWSPVLASGPMTATARARDDCRLIAFNAPQLLALCERDPALGVEFMRRTALALSQRLHATRLQLHDARRREPPVAAAGDP